MNADLWPHVWLFRLWAATLTAILPFDPFNPHIEDL